MAQFVIKNPVVTVNGVDLSNHCSKATVATQYEAVDATAFGATFKQVLQGAGDASVTLTMQQDFAAGSVDATLWPLSQSGSSFPVTIRGTNAATSATNPRFDMTGVLLSYNPIDGAYGDLANTDVTIQNAAQSGITRNIV